MKNYVTYNSPIGLLYLLSEDGFLVGLLFRRPDQIGNYAEKENQVLRKTKKQLDEYFQGKRKDFEIELRMSGTDFQKKAWQGLRKIPYGQTISYSGQAKAARLGKAVRAIGTANGQNPISIIVPCHRVIRTDGTLGGYGGGLPIKEFLLNLES